MERRLWTKDFTIIILGSAISMLGNNLIGFAISLFVLDYTNTTFLYAVYVFLFTLPQIVAPVVAGPLMDRFSRRRTIYLLDFLSAGLYLGIGVLIRAGVFSFPLLSGFTLAIGTINSVYAVAFQSFFPMLITEGNYSKGYSVSTTLETLACVMVPVSSYLYNRVGISPLLMGTSCFFLTAAVVETRISDVESAAGAERPAAYGLREYIADSREGIRYLLGERGLLLITAYFAVNSFAGGASYVLTLPWFRMSFPNGEYIYMFVWAFMALSRVFGSFLHYRWKMPAGWKFAAALLTYIVSALLEAVYLYTPLAAMCACCFVMGVLSATSYNIRISATQSYVPNEKKGRFNGAFLMLTTVGSLTGELFAGAATTAASMRTMISGVMGLCAVAAVILIGGGQKHVKLIYNRDT